MAKSDRQTNSEHFTKMLRTTMETDAWRSLPCSAQALYPHLKLEWKGAKANTNGKIRLSTRQAAQRLGIGQDAARRAFHCLQAKGFLVVVEPASLGATGQAKSPAFEITELALPGQTKGRMLYRNWKPGSDFAVVKTLANNPLGKNKTLTRKSGQDDMKIVSKWVVFDGRTT